MHGVLGSGINFVEGALVGVLYSAGDPEDCFVHVISKSRFNGEAVYFELRCAPRAWRREHRAEAGEVPTCLWCVAGRVP